MDHNTIINVWNKGRIVPGYNPNLIRQDQCGSRIRFIDYGDRNSLYGWEIDHIIPVNHGGGDQLSNLRPLQWENNLSKSDGKLICRIRTR